MAGWEKARRRARHEGAVEVTVDLSFGLLRWRAAAERFYEESWELLGRLELAELKRALARVGYWLGATADVMAALRKAHGVAQVIWGAAAFVEVQKTQRAVSALQVAVAEVLEQLEKGLG